MPSSDADPVAHVLSAVRATIQRERLLAGDGRVLVAVSGGADSTCLLDVLVSLYGTERMVVAHVDHGFRADSGRDGDRVQALAARIGVPCESVRVDGPAFAREHRRGMEAAGRLLRYRALAEIAARRGCTAVVTGHTRDDAVESFLLHLLRGSGLDGLGGISPSEPLAPDTPTPRGETSGEASGDEADGDRAATSQEASGDAAGRQGHSGLAGGGATMLERPLLGVGRRDTAEYCRARGLEWLVDPTNDDLSHVRNRIRHHLLPVLRTYAPSIDATLDRTARLMRDDRAWIDGMVAREWLAAGTGEDDGASLDLGHFAGAPTALRRRLARRAVEAAGGHPDTLSFDAVERIVAVAAAGGAPRAELGGGLIATRDGGRLHLRRFG